MIPAGAAAAMGTVAASPADALVLGILAGIQLVLILLALLVANAYRERVLLLHAAGTGASVLIAWLQSQGSPYVPQALMVLMALASLHLRGLTSHVGSLRQRQNWTTGAALLIVVIGLADLASPWMLLPVATAVWIAVATLVTLRAWPQSQPWAVWTLPAHVALVAATLRYGLADRQGTDLVLAGILAFWSIALYLATVWRSRVFGESRSSQAMVNTFNPLTGLSTPVVLMQRVAAARSLMKRYGHPSSLLLVHVDHLHTIGQKLGAEVAEGAALEAGTRIRDALGAGDVGARVGQHRFLVLSEGTPPPEAASGLGARILTAGLRAPLSAVPGNYLQFRIVLTDLPRDGVMVPELMGKLGERLDADVARARDKRMRALPSSELMLTQVPGGDAVATTY